MNNKNSLYTALILLTLYAVFVILTRENYDIFRSPITCEAARSWLNQTDPPASYRFLPYSIIKFLTCKLSLARLTPLLFILLSAVQIASIAMLSASKKGAVAAIAVLYASLFIWHDINEQNNLIAYDISNLTVWSTAILTIKEMASNGGRLRKLRASFKKTISFTFGVILALNFENNFVILSACSGLYAAYTRFSDNLENSRISAQIYCMAASCTIASLVNIADKQMKRLEINTHGDRFVHVSEQYFTFGIHNSFVHIASLLTSLFLIALFITAASCAIIDRRFIKAKIKGMTAMMQQEKTYFLGLCALSIAASLAFTTSLVAADHASIIAFGGRPEDLAIANNGFGVYLLEQIKLHKRYLVMLSFAIIILSAHVTCVTGRIDEFKASKNARHCLDSVQVLSLFLAAGFLLCLIPARYLSGIGSEYTRQLMPLILFASAWISRIGNTEKTSQIHQGNVLKP